MSASLSALAKLVEAAFFLVLAKEKRGFDKLSLSGSFFGHYGFVFEVLA